MRAIAFAILVALSSAGCGGQLPSPTPSVPAVETPSDPPSTSTSESAAPIPSRSPASDLPVWAVDALPTPEPTGFGGVWPTGITVGGPGYVAVGRESPCCADASYEDNPWQTVIWTSADGRDWQLVPDLDSFGKSGLNAVASDAEGTMLAVGYDVLPPSGDDPMHLFRMSASAWRSMNGIDWLRIPGIEGDDLHDVVATPHGWVVAGAVEGQPALFTSIDGSTWTARTFEGTGSMERVAVSPAGTVVAIGCIAPDTETVCQSTTFASRDAATWTEGDASLVLARDLVWWHDEFAVIGSDEDVTAARLWTSPDGLAWTAGPELLRFVTGRIDVLAVDGDRLIGAGSRISGDPPTSRPSVWQTSDGISWEPLAQLADAEGVTSGQATSLFAGDGGLTVMGNAFAIRGGQPYVWVGEP